MLGISVKGLMKNLKTPRILREYKPGIEKLVMAISTEESEQLLLAMWGMEHKGEEDHMQFRVMIDELEYFIELRVQS